MTVIMEESSTFINDSHHGRKFYIYQWQPLWKKILHL